MQLVKKIIKGIGLGGLFKKDNNRKSYIDSSKEYWEKRYLSNKTSGPGSYGQLAEFKAEVLNRFVEEHHIEDVLELGCGDGHQLTLSKYSNYIGFDVSDQAIALCKALFGHDSSKQFYSMFDMAQTDLKAELTLSLDVIFHLVEDEVFDAYMERLFGSSTKYVIIYSSNYDGYLAQHVRCRKFTDWISEHVSADWELIESIKNKYAFDASNPDTTSMADFYIYKKKSKEVN